jgi:DNA-binding SARP family transcriptional activator
MTAVSIEPLRESAQRVLVQAHLDENNWIEAERAFATYRRLVHDELGVAPSPELSSLIETSGQRTSAARIPSQRRSAAALPPLSDRDARLTLLCGPVSDRQPGPLFHTDSSCHACR